MSLKIANNAYGILAAGISSGAVTIPLSTGHGARLGAFAAGDYMFATLMNAANQLEIVKITGRSDDTITVVRGQDGTTPMSFSSGDRIECRPCNAAFKAAMFEAGYGPDTGSANAYALTLEIEPPAYFDGMRVYFKAANANTGASTLAVGTLGAVPLKYFDGADLNAGQVLVGQIIEAVYQGSFFQIINTIISGSPWSTGDWKLTWKTTADPGWIMANDGSIGDATSGATTRANADTEALYTLLYNVITTPALVVQNSSGVTVARGADAATDFAAHRRLVLPKSLGHAIAIAGSGAGLTTRPLGSTVGTETHKLTGAQSGVAAHSHTASTAAGGGTIGNVEIPINNAVGSTGGAGIGGCDTGPNDTVTVTINGDPHTHAVTVNAATAADAAEAHPNLGPRFHGNVMFKL